MSLVTLDLVPTCMTLHLALCRPCHDLSRDHRARRGRISLQSCAPSDRVQQASESGRSEGQLANGRLHGASRGTAGRSEEHTSELQSLMRTSYAVFCLKKKN